MGRKKRRTFDAQFKFETMIEALRGEKSAAEICWERDINENLLSRWKQEFLSKVSEDFEWEGEPCTSHMNRFQLALERQSSNILDVVAGECGGGFSRYRIIDNDTFCGPIIVFSPNQKGHVSPQIGAWTIILESIGKVVWK